MNFFMKAYGNRVNRNLCIFFPYLKLLLLEQDIVDIVGGAFDFNLVLSRPWVLLNTDLTMSKIKSLLLTTLNLYFNDHSLSFMLALRLQLNLANSRQDFNNLGRLGTGLTLGQNGNWDLSRAILKQQVLAVVHLVAVGGVIEGANVVGLNPAGGRNLVVAQFVGNMITDADGKKSLGALNGQTDVLDGPLAARVFNLELGFVTGTAEVHNNFDFLIRPDGRVLVNLKLANEVGFDNLFHPDEGRLVLQFMGQFNLQLDPVKGGSLVTDLHASRRQNHALLFVSLTPKVFR